MDEWKEGREGGKKERKEGRDIGHFPFILTDVSISTPEGKRHFSPL